MSEASTLSAWAKAAAITMAVLGVGAAVFSAGVSWGGAEAIPKALAEVRADVKQIQSDVNGLKSDSVDIRWDLRDVRRRLDRIENEPRRQNEFRRFREGGANGG